MAHSREPLFTSWWRKTRLRKQKRKLPQKLETDVKELDHNKVMNYRMRDTFSSRMSVVNSLIYFGALGFFWYTARKSDFKMVSAAHSELMGKAKSLITKQFPRERRIIFNESSIGGAYPQHANFSIQFSASNFAGIGNFTATATEPNRWKFNEAELLVKHGSEVERIPIELNKENKDTKDTKPVN